MHCYHPAPPPPPRPAPRRRLHQAYTAVEILKRRLEESEASAQSAWEEAVRAGSRAAAAKARVGGGGADGSVSGAGAGGGGLGGGDSAYGLSGELGAEVSNQPPQPLTCQVLPMAFTIACDRL